MAPEPVYPLYASTYHLHSLSPLYNFSPSTLPRHAHSLHNLLRGEVLRGVRVGLGESISDNILARIGSLQSITWKKLIPEEEWEQEQERRRQIEAGEIGVDDDNTVDVSEREADEGLGNIVEIKYEKARYTAILLRDEANEGEGDEDELGAAFTTFPLLLTKMPGPLRETFLAFLAEKFDTRPSVLKLSPKFLTKSLESYLRDLTTAVDGSGDGGVDGMKANRILRDVVKDLNITRTFALSGDAAGTLKSLDITVSRDDLWPLLIRGRKLVELRREGRQANGSPEEENPFTTALSHHIDGQLALNLDHKSVGMSRIACGAFILVGEGKVKFAQLPKLREGVDEVVDGQERAAKALMDGLIEFSKRRGVTR